MPKFVLRAEPSKGDGDEQIVDENHPLPTTATVTGGLTVNAVDVAVHDFATPANKLKVGANGSIDTNLLTAFPADQLVHAANLDIALSALRDALKGGKTLADVVTALGAVVASVTGSVAVTNFPATQPVSGTVAVSNLPGTQAVSGTVAVNNFPATEPITMTERLLSKRPLSGNNLWFDTADTSYIYIMEAAIGVAAGTVGFQGIRLTLDANGNVVGEVQQNTNVATLTFSNRATDTHWA